MATGTGRAPDKSTIDEAEMELPALGSADERIRRRAHEIWFERGCPAGAEMDHWLAAEEEIRGTIES